MSDMWEIVVFIPAAVLCRERGRGKEQKRQTETQTDRQTDRQTGRQTN